VLKYIQMSNRDSHLMIVVNRMRVMVSAKDGEHARHGAVSGAHLLLEGLAGQRYTVPARPMSQENGRSPAASSSASGCESDTTRAVLRERVKELECLYGISRVLQNASGLEEALRGVIELLPRGFQYTEMASARIRVGESSFQTPSFPENGCLLVEPIPAGGLLEVAYPSGIEKKDPSPFLLEERNLVEKAAADISLAVERSRSAKEKKKLETQLRHADRLASVGVLAAGVAHELNEPLATILGFAQLAGKAPGLPAQAARDMERIIEACLRAREIVRTLLIFGGNAPAKTEDCDLERIVRDGIRFLEPRCRTGGIQLALELSETPLFRADPVQINQVLVNIVVNAVQAMPAGGRLMVRTGRGEGHAILVVQDTGVGMSFETIEKIFVPFFTTKGIGGGTGLGLAMVHGIVSSLGGTISVESAVGRGSRFEVRIPARLRGAREGEGE